MTRRRLPALLIIVGIISLIATVQAQTNGACTGFNSRLAPGMTARVLPGDPNTLRSGAGTSYQRIGSIPAGNIVTVISGPRCGGGYTWWQVEYGSLVGWTAEGPVGTFWLEPASNTSASNGGSARISVADLLQGIAWGGGGGPGDDPVCELVTSVVGYNTLSERLKEYEYFPNGTVVTPSLNQYSETGVCLDTGITPIASEVFVITPRGNILQVNTLYGDSYNYTLSMYDNKTAFSFEDLWCSPGRYEIHISDFTYYVQLRNPLSIIRGPVAMPPCTGISFAGFQPGERVAVLAGNGDNVRQILTTNADSNGFLFVEDAVAAAGDVSGVAIADKSAGPVLSLRFDRLNCELPMERIIGDALIRGIPMNQEDWMCVGRVGVFIG